MEREPLEIFKQKDPEMFNNIVSGRKLAYAEGTLPAKYKFLIALALDSSLGAANGVKSLAGQAIAAGATKEEILDAVRVAYFICGAHSAYTAAQALGEIL
jgi:alkylhydroperoxidase/carboxymuconolactone decarboxylase family protein YurZ